MRESKEERSSRRYEEFCEKERRCGRDPKALTPKEIARRLDQEGKKVMKTRLL